MCILLPKYLAHLTFQLCVTITDRTIIFFQKRIHIIWVFNILTQFNLILESMLGIFINFDNNFGFEMSHFPNKLSTPNINKGKMLFVSLNTICHLKYVLLIGTVHLRIIESFRFKLIRS